MQKKHLPLIISVFSTIIIFFVFKYFMMNDTMHENVYNGESSKVYLNHNGDQIYVADSNKGNVTVSQTWYFDDIEESGIMMSCDITDFKDNAKKGGRVVEETIKVEYFGSSDKEWNLQSAYATIASNNSYVFFDINGTLKGEKKVETYKLQGTTYQVH